MSSVDDDSFGRALRSVTAEPDLRTRETNRHLRKEAEDLAKQRQASKDETRRVKRLEHELKDWDIRLRAREASLDAEYNK